MTGRRGTSVRVAYAGYDFFSGCLRALLELPDVEVVLCLTGTPGEPIGEIVRLCGQGAVPVHFGRPTAHAVAAVNRLEVDLLVSAAYSYRIPVEELKIRQAVNVHSTLLPFGRGPNPLPYLLDGQRRFSGVTVHEMNHEFDRGPVLVQREIPVDDADGFDELSLKMFAAAPPLVAELIRRFPVTPADARPGPDGSYWPLQPLSERSFRVEEDDAESVRRLVAKFGMSGVVAELPDGARYCSGNVAAVSCAHGFPVGTVVSRAASGWIMALPDGLVRMTDPAPVD